MSPPSEGFKQSQKSGTYAEKLVKSILESVGISSEFVEYEKRSDYDLLCRNGTKEFTLEVKFDKKAAETGNIAIEYYNPLSKKDSGVSSTKADLWAVVLMDDVNPTVWLTTVEKLKLFIKDTTPKKIIKVGGDKNASLYLYDDKVILQIFQRVDNISKDEILKIIKDLLKKPKKKKGNDNGE